MRLRLAGILIALVLPATAAAAVPFKAVLKAPTADPKINVRWYYSIRVTDLKGNPIAATLTVRIRDPLGGVHPVALCNTTTKYIVNRPFRGVFRDCIIFPRESRGFQLTLIWIVKAKGAKKTLTRTVVPR